jgi:hypothetical protein
MLFKEILSVYIDNHTKHISAKQVLLAVRAGGTLECKGYSPVFKLELVFLFVCFVCYLITLPR